MTDTLAVHLPREVVEWFAAHGPSREALAAGNITLNDARGGHAVSAACREALEAERREPSESEWARVSAFLSWLEGWVTDENHGTTGYANAARDIGYALNRLLPFPAPEPTTESGEPTERGEAGSREAPDTESEAGSSVAPSVFSPLRAERIGGKRQQRINEDFLLALDTSDPNMVRNAEIAALRADEARRVVGEIVARLTFDSGVFGISGKRAIAIVREYGGQS